MMSAPGAEEMEVASWYSSCPLGLKYDGKVVGAKHDLKALEKKQKHGHLHTRFMPPLKTPSWKDTEIEYDYFMYRITIPKGRHIEGKVALTMPKK